uniref:CBF domain-containing protein n=1 Tax=Dracunculus medinensis TaxID=318479 RepID=A0A0N4U7S2_DRAME
LQNNFYSDKSLLLPNTLIKRLVPYLSGTVLSAMKNGQLAGDFLFRIFNLGDIFSILSLEGIFKLITEHNFEYPNFYKSVYRITTPFICYLSYREKFLNLLDTFLSSTHLPAYIVASFVKKLSRLALYAPFSFQEPLLALIQNLLIRHDTLHFLLHRDEPATFEMDPYDMDNVSLKENGALLSSLWEIKMLQKHWLFDITKRTSFVDKGISSMESFLRWKSSDNYFDQIMQKKFGKDLAKNGLENKFINNQTGHDDNNDDEGDFSDEPKNKRRKMASNNRQSKNNYEVPIKENEPDKEFFSFLTCKVDF